MFESDREYRIEIGRKVMTKPFAGFYDPPHGECVYFYFGDPDTTDWVMSADGGRTFYKYYGNKAVEVKISSI